MKKIKLTLSIFTLLFFFLLTESCQEDTINDVEEEQNDTDSDNNTDNDVSTITASDFEVTVNENTESEQVLDKLSATTTTGTLNYTIKNSDGDGAIKIETDGTIKVDNSIELDFEKREKITLIITVFNGIDSVDITLIVNINDVDESINTPIGTTLTPPAERGLVEIREANNGASITYQGKQIGESINIDFHSSIITLPTTETTYNIVGNILNANQVSVAYVANQDNTLVTYASHLSENGGQFTLKPLGNDLYECEITNAVVKTFSFTGDPSLDGILNFKFTGIKSTTTLSSTNISTFSGVTEQETSVASLTTTDYIDMYSSITQVSPSLNKMGVSIRIPKESTSGTYTITPSFFVPSDFSGKQVILNFYEGTHGQDRYLAQSGTVEIVVDGDYYTATFNNLATKKITISGTNVMEEDTGNKVTGTLKGERTKIGFFAED